MNDFLHFSWNTSLSWTDGGCLYYMLLGTYREHPLSRLYDCFAEWNQSKKNPGDNIRSQSASCWYINFIFSTSIVRIMISFNQMF